MRPLSVPELLNVWELGLGNVPLQRALTILSAANPECPPSALARLSVGRRDSDLLQLREWAFGKRFNVVADCPCCKQTLEFDVPAEELRGNIDVTANPVSHSECSVELRDRENRSYQIRFRPINSEDIAACAGMDLAAAQSKLIWGCVLDASREGAAITPNELPDELSHRLLEQLAASDPAADRRIELRCPDCQERWKEVFDIVSFFWTEIDGWARRTLREVNLLARVYGWPESEILAMSPMRRQIYVSMAQA